MTCKDICIRHKAQKPVGSGRYAIGQKRCQICEIFLKWDGLWCPCCGYRLRTKPRNLNTKLNLELEKKSKRDDGTGIYPCQKECIIACIEYTNYVTNWIPSREFFYCNIVSSCNT